MLQGHIEANKHDVDAKRSLLRKVAKRRSFLRYLKDNNMERYTYITDLLKIQSIRQFWKYKLRNKKIINVGSNAELLTYYFLNCYLTSGMYRFDRNSVVFIAILDDSSQ
jgi:ribosomal protein S15P/S13E